MDRYSPWQAVAEMTDIKIVFETMPENLGLWDPDNRTITLHPGQSQREMRSTLAHELEHARRGDEGIGHVSPVLAARQEIAVCTAAARRLIGLDALLSALLWSQDEYEVAEELNVDEDTLRIRLLTLTPEEHAELDRRMADVYPAEEESA